MGTQFQHAACFKSVFVAAIFFFLKTIGFSDGVGILTPCNATDGNFDGIPDNADNCISSASDADNLQEIKIRGMGLTGLSPALAKRVTVRIQLASDSEDGLSSISPEQKFHVFELREPNQMSLGDGTNILSILGSNCPWISTEDKTLFIEGIIPGGSAKIQTTVSFDGQLVGMDEIRVRTKPFIVLSNCDTATAIFVSKYDDSWFDFIEDMTNAFENILPVIIDETAIPFAQDQAEFGAFWPETEKSLIWGMKHNAYTNLLSSSTGYFEYLAAGYCGGNIESIPPTTRFPHGRIVVGNTIPPSGIEFLQSQTLQTDNGSLIVLDVEWLVVGHVDEVMAVLPTPNGKFKILLADIRLAVDLLAQNPNIDEYGPDIAPLLSPYLLEENQIKINAIQSRLDGIRQTLLEHLDIQPDDILPVPVLFSIPTSSTIVQRSIVAKLPNSVNLVAVKNNNGTLRIAIPNPLFVPFTDYLADLFFTLGFTENEIKPIRTIGPHSNNGESHCASNVVRQRNP